MSKHSIVLVMMAATLVVLVFGLILMTIGGKLSRRYSGLIMTLRVMMQAIAVGLVVLMMRMHG